ncbi:homeodomain-like domain protein [Bordetella pertussis STO1-CHOC-0021]|nr:homeodomain-like domain protein [Bordetella pertussis STO1-CHOC-0021]
MNTHKHARLTFLRRLEMVQQLIAHQVCVPEAARAYGVTAPTVRKWLGRFLAQGQTEERRVGKECRSRGAPDH